MRRLLLIGLALLGVALPGTALAASTTTPSPSVGTATSPFSIGVPQATTTQSAPTTPQVITTAQSSGNGSFSALDAIIIGAAVVLVIAAIVWFVMRDSRAAAGQLKPAASVPGGVRGGSKPQRPRKLSAQEKKRRKRGRAPRRR